jgi:hypothetical protein
MTGNVLSGLVEKIEKTPEMGVFFIKMSQKGANKPKNALFTPVEKSGVHCPPLAGEGFTNQMFFQTGVD